MVEVSVMVYENWPRMDHQAGCRCTRCRGRGAIIERLADQSLSVALRHAQSRFEGAIGTEAAAVGRDITLPGKFTGWDTVRAVTVNELFGGTPPREYTVPPVRGVAPGLLYRISGTTPLYIGMAPASSIRGRVASHFRHLITRRGRPAQTQQAKDLRAKTDADFDNSGSEVERLRLLIAPTRLRGLKVECGKVWPSAGYPMDFKLLRAFEAALQVLERPKAYVGDVWTFEDVL
jgi:hypothetical protein